MFLENLVIDLCLVQILHLHLQGKRIRLEHQIEEGYTETARLTHGRYLFKNAYCLNQSAYLIFEHS